MDTEYEDVKFCKDCRWFKRELGGDMRCTHSKAKITTLDIVEGKLTTDHLYCSAMRTKGGVCGEEGRLWEAQG